MTAENYEGVQEAMRGSPALQQQATDKCVSETHFTPAVAREAAFTMKVPNNDGLTRTFCKRLLAGLVSGKLAYEDLYSTRDTLPPKVVRVLQQR